MDGMKFCKHLPFPAQVATFILWRQHKVLHHNGGEALQFNRLQSWIFRADDIPGAPEPKGDALAVEVPGGGADIALVQAPAHALGEGVLGVKRQAQGSFQQRSGHGVAGRRGGSFVVDGTRRRGIRRQQAMGGEQRPLVCNKPIDLPVFLGTSSSVRFGEGPLLGCPLCFEARRPGQGARYLPVVPDRKTVDSFSFWRHALRRQLLLTGLAALPLAATVSVTLGSSLVQAQQPTKPQTLTVVSYAVTKTAYDQIFKLFAADWKKRTG